MSGGFLQRIAIPNPNPNPIGKIRLKKLFEYLMNE